MRVDPKADKTEDQLASILGEQFWWLIQKYCRVAGSGWLIVVQGGVVKLGHRLGHSNRLLSESTMPKAVGVITGCLGLLWAPWEALLRSSYYNGGHGTELCGWG